MELSSYNEHVAFLESTEQSREWPEYIRFLEDPTVRKGEKRKYRGSADRFFLEGGELFKKSRKKRRKLVDDDGTMEELPPQKVVRADEMHALLQSEHDAFVARNAGRHPGQNKMQEQIGRRFYWKNFSRDVEEWMKTCPGCLREKPAPRDSRPPMQTHAFQNWDMDVLGPFSTPSVDGHRYVIVLTEPCTKWAEAFPAQDVAAESVFQALKSVIGRFGVPNTIGVDLDQGSVDDLNDKFSSIMGAVPPIAFICKTGQPDKSSDDRFNAYLCWMISEFVSDGLNTTWESNLQLKLLEYRTAVQTGDGGLRPSPFELLYGLKPRTSVRDSSDV
ncbi:uncharacterized protein [Littorina saxatilis]|uniref:Integrase catalytic domain-containing protein n=1 Tax=Littorina saxatilis TaxID=31220 RepID=A0AAN9BRQ7_9CAEN